MTRKTAFALYAIVAIAAFVFAMFFPNVTRADTISGNQDSCTQMADDVKFAAELRDAGVPWATVVFAMEQFLAESKTQPDSYIKDAEDADNFRSVISTVYNESSYSPDKLHESFLKFCMRGSV